MLETNQAGTNQPKLLAQRHRCLGGWLGQFARALTPKGGTIGGYIPGPHGFDSLIVGYYRGKDLMYVARVRNRFVPASRRQVFEKIRQLVSPIMPFSNLPDTHKSHWGRRIAGDSRGTWREVLDC